MIIKQNEHTNDAINKVNSGEYNSSCGHKLIIKFKVSKYLLQKQATRSQNIPSTSCKVRIIFSQNTQ